MAPIDVVEMATTTSSFSVSWNMAAENRMVTLWKIYYRVHNQQMWESEDVDNAMEGTVDLTTHTSHVPGTTYNVAIAAIAGTRSDPSESDMSHSIKITTSKLF